MVYASAPYFTNHAEAGLGHYARFLYTNTDVTRRLQELSLHTKHMHAKDTP